MIRSRQVIAAQGYALAAAVAKRREESADKNEQLLRDEKNREILRKQAEQDKAVTTALTTAATAAQVIPVVGQFLGAVLGAVAALYNAIQRIYPRPLRGSSPPAIHYGRGSYLGLYAYDPDRTVYDRDGHLLPVSELVDRIDLDPFASALPQPLPDQRLPSLPTLQEFQGAVLALYPSAYSDYGYGQPAEDGSLPWVGTAAETAGGQRLPVDAGPAPRLDDDRGLIGRWFYRQGWNGADFYNEVLAKLPPAVVGSSQAGLPELLGDWLGFTADYNAGRADSQAIGTTQSKGRWAAYNPGVPYPAIVAPAPPLPGSDQKGERAGVVAQLRGLLLAGHAQYQRIRALSALPQRRTPQPPADVPPPVVVSSLPEASAVLQAAATNVGALQAIGDQLADGAEQPLGWAPPPSRFVEGGDIYRRFDRQATLWLRQSRINFGGLVDQKLLSLSRQVGFDLGGALAPRPAAGTPYPDGVYLFDVL